MDEHDPVDASEFVYRRVHPRFYDSHLSLPVLFEAFRPAKRDSTGLSVLRALFARPEDVLPPDPTKAAGYHVAKLAVRDLFTLGLTVKPEPIVGGPPGHAVIPELSWSAYDLDKNRLRPVLIELGRLAGLSIVL